ncbi:double-strand break repair protein AddB [uncultured Enterovirga sp.]|uniref:double-strand break repair protein AddB n=1 Tax=uncultured Enterovirga sp. TaxID=2026352 RepID=UPI0035CBEB3A
MTARAGEARVFTIPAGTPFLATLADALLDGRLTDGWPKGAELADATIYLPTRRAGRALTALLADRAAGRAALMPRIVPLGEQDGDAAALSASGARPPLTALERRLILARLVQAWAARADRPEELAGSPADAVALAGDLEGLMDALATEGVPWEALQQAVETDFSTYFALTLRFVRIAHEEWPQILAIRSASDPARHQHDALGADADRLAAFPPRGPVIAAGSTGSVPATARLLAAIARLPTGAVVLPGLDTHLDPAAWDSIGGGEGGPASADPIWGHPQFMMRRLLHDHLRVGREAVRILGPAHPAAAPAEMRRRLVSEVMRPAETTDSWAALVPADRQAVAEAGTAGLALVEAADEREEGLAIAIALRETLASPGRIAALVTPDRGLARRVSAELGRWGVEVEDSAGLPLGDSPAGRLARLAAEAVALDFHPVRVLALLAHPAVTLGLAREEVERAAAALEIGALRGPAPRPGLDGIAAALALRHDELGPHDPLPRQSLSESDWKAAGDIVQRLKSAFAGFVESAGEALERGASFEAPLRGAPQDEDRREIHPIPHAEVLAEGEPRSTQDGSTSPDNTVDLAALASRHADTIAALTEPASGTEAPDLHGLSALLDLFDDLALSAGREHAVVGGFADYPAFFLVLARERLLAPEARAAHRRIRILGLLEARLLDIDRVVLGGLDEGIWPPVPETDSLLNRPMRLALGLSPPERRIGQSAHDFAQALGCADVVMTRARKRDGKPTVPSRFLERLKAFAGEPSWSAMTRRGGRFLHLGAALDRPRAVVPLRRPAPQPGAERFPRRLSVTEIETLVRDPYAIYARHILKLSALDPVATRPSLGDRGTILHEILASFAAAYPGALPAHARDDLLQRALDAFAPLQLAYPELYALWVPEFERIVPRYLAWEEERRAGLAGLDAEKYGRLDIPLASGEPLSVRGLADRIEISDRGQATIVDYKSGRMPSVKEVQIGFSPQLTLEAAMLQAGGFDGVLAAIPVPDLLYVKLGGRDRLKAQEIKPKDGKSLAEMVDDHLAGLTRLARLYAEEGAGYMSRPYAQYARRFSSYDHLARVGEWSVTDGGDSEA